MQIGSDEWSRLIIEGAGAWGLELKSDHTRLFARHAEQLLKWNQVTNLTAITHPRDVAISHFLDSLIPAVLIPAHSGLLDVGSGGGFPGLPLHIVVPGLRTTLVDSSRKKVSFLRQVIRELRLERIQALQARVQDLSALSEGHAEGYDVIISRAFSALAVFVRLTLGLLRPQGCIIALKGDVPASEMEALRRLEGSVIASGLILDERRYMLPGVKSQRSLLIITRKSVNL
jgi:16S rRNA (guanine527-N7)-methyltransferase